MRRAGPGSSAARACVDAPAVNIRRHQRWRHVWVAGRADTGILGASTKRCSQAGRGYAVLEGGANGDGAWRGLVTIVELIDRCPYKSQSPVYGRLIYTVTYMSDRLLTQANPNLHLPPPPELRRDGGVVLSSELWLCLRL